MGYLRRGTNPPFQAPFPCKKPSPGILPRTAQQQCAPPATSRSPARRPTVHRAPHASRAYSRCAPRPPAAGAGSGARERSARIDERGREEETTDSHQHSHKPPLLGCGGENHPDHAPPTRRRPRRAGVADRDPRGRGLARRGAPSKEKTREKTFYLGTRRSAVDKRARTCRSRAARAPRGVGARARLLARRGRGRVT